MFSKRALQHTSIFSLNSAFIHMHMLCFVVWWFVLGWGFGFLFVWFCKLGFGFISLLKLPFFNPCTERKSCVLLGKYFFDLLSVLFEQQFNAMFSVHYVFLNATKPLADFVFLEAGHA